MQTKADKVELERKIERIDFVCKDVQIANGAIQKKIEKLDNHNKLLRDDFARLELKTNSIREGIDEKIHQVRTSADDRFHKMDFRVKQLGERLENFENFKIASLHKDDQYEDGIKDLVTNLAKLK